MFIIFQIFFTTRSVLKTRAKLAGEQALHLGLTRDFFLGDLFWAQAASGRERIGAGACWGELTAMTEEFSFLLRLGEAKSHWLKMTCINQFSPRM